MKKISIDIVGVIGFVLLIWGIFQCFGQGIASMSAGVLMFAWAVIKGSRQ